jgi:VanZ family protein
VSLKKRNIAALSAVIRTFHCILGSQKNKKMKLLYFWKPLLWLAIICYALFVPASDLPVKPFLNIPHFDKMVHFTLFFVFCVFLLRPFKKLNTSYYLWAPAISVALSALLEFSQRIVTPSRASDFYDFLANTTGVLAATLFFRLFVVNRQWEKLF